MNISFSSNYKLWMSFCSILALLCFHRLQADEHQPIPLEKLVCYGQGTNSNFPSGEYLAAMVPVDENVYDIKDETDQKTATDRVGSYKS